MAVRRRYDPCLETKQLLRIEGVAPFQPKIKAAVRSAIDLKGMAAAARGRMTDEISFNLQWGDERKGGRPFVANQSGKAKIVFLDRASDVVVLHPLLARPETPNDVRGVAVFAGALHIYCRGVQKRPLQTPYEHEATAEWYEAAMSTHPAAEFFADYLQRFFDWAAALTD